MITTILSVLGTGWGLVNANWWTRGLMGLLVVFGAWKANNYIVGKKAVARHIEKSVKEGRRNNERARKIRKGIYSGKGSVGSIPCRDC